MVSGIGMLAVHYLGSVDLEGEDCMDPAISCILGVQRCLGGWMLTGNHMNARTRSFPGEHCTVLDDQCSSSVSGFNVVADWCMYVLSSVEFVFFNVLCLDRVMLISTKFKVKNRQKEMITRIRVIPCQLTQNAECRMQNAE